MSNFFVVSNVASLVAAVPPHVPRLKETGDCHYFDQYGEIDTTEKEPKKIDPSVFNGF